MTRFAWFAVVTLSLVTVRAVCVGAQVDEGNSKAGRQGFISLMPDEKLRNWKGVVGNPKIRARMSRRRLARVQRLADADMRVHWKVRNEILMFDGQGKTISTDPEFGDFELYIDWKIPSGGQSGVNLRGCPQVQIWDTALENLGANVGSGGLHYNRTNPSKPLIKADRPAGQWNTFYIKMVGDRVTVKLNDQLVVNDAVLENYWDTGEEICPRGAIELQANGSQVWFRNIYIREIPSTR